MRTITGAALCLFCAAVVAKPSIPYERFTLPNGLQFIVHEDHKAPIVAIRVVYHVGAKDEPVGKTGFAHLFEHLLFKGSEHFKGDFLKTLDDAGATDVNATTTQDTTTYFETVPTSALERVLWLESERMGHFGNVITQTLLDSERGVVRNEKLQREGSGFMDGLVMQRLFSDGHPYQRPVLGSMADLNAASVSDVRNWHSQYYGAKNSVVVLSGDVKASTARQLAEKYFSDVPPGEAIYRDTRWIAERTFDARAEVETRAPRSGLQRHWVVPGPQTRDYALLSIAARVLSDPFASRLREDLVKRRKLASAIGVSLEPFELASVFTISMDLETDADIVQLESAIDSHLASFLKTGPTEDELRKVKRDFEARQLWGLQSVADKASVLSDGAIFTGDPSFNDTVLGWTLGAKRADVARALQRWLSRGYLQVKNSPLGELKARESGVEHPIMPALAADLALEFPPTQETRLSNGLTVVLAERHEAPTLHMTLALSGAGRIGDTKGSPGISAATFAIMGKGPAGLTRAQYAEQLARLQASIDMRVGMRDARSSLTVLTKDLPMALRLWRRALLEPAFRAEDLQELRDEVVQSIEDSSTDPAAAGASALAHALFPPGHPYAVDFANAARVETIRKRELSEFHAKWMRPDVAKLFVVGDTTLPELTRALEQVFSGWRPPSHSMPDRSASLPNVSVPREARFILVDWPQEPQARIFAGRAVPGAESAENLHLRAANDLLGATPSSRLGQRIRVEKGWSYGVHSTLDGNLGQQYWGISTQVQADRAAEAVAEIADVLNDFSTTEPGTTAELARYVKGATRSFHAAFENSGAVLAAMVESDAYGHPYDWAEGVEARLDSITLEDVTRVSREYLLPRSLTWVIVGDLSVFEEKLRAQASGTIEVWDAEGHRIR